MDGFADDVQTKVADRATNPSVNNVSRIFTNNGTLHPMDR